MNNKDFEKMKAGWPTPEEFAKRIEGIDTKCDDGKIDPYTIQLEEGAAIPIGVQKKDKENKDETPNILRPIRS